MEETHETQQKAEGMDKILPTLEELRERQNNFQKRRRETKERTEPLTEHEKRYREKLKQSEAAQMDYSLSGLLAAVNSKPKGRKVIPYQIQMEDAKKLMVAIMERELSVNNQAFVVEPGNKPKLAELVCYFTGNANKLNPSKGIYLYGPVGRGKTLIMQSLAQMCLLVEQKMEAAGIYFTCNRFQIKNAKSIVAELAENKKPEVMKKYYSGVWCIDDLGAEDSYKLFGNEMNVVGDIIIERYQRYQQSGLLTHATSNVDPKDWKDKYGDRVASRMSEMFNPVLLVGEDKRK
jgi:DNA replication protein DnaC